MAQMSPAGCALSAEQLEMDEALEAIYASDSRRKKSAATSGNRPTEGRPHGAVKGRSMPRVARWLDQIRNFLPQRRRGPAATGRHRTARHEGAAVRAGDHGQSRAVPRSGQRGAGAEEPGPGKGQGRGPRPGPAGGRGIAEAPGVAASPRRSAARSTAASTARSAACRTSIGRAPSAAT